MSGFPRPGSTELTFPTAADRASPVWTRLSFYPHHVHIQHVTEDRWQILLAGGGFDHVLCQRGAYARAEEPPYGWNNRCGQHWYSGEPLFLSFEDACALAVRVVLKTVEVQGP